MRYKKRDDYEEFTVNYGNKEILRLACCDCGLVHSFAFHVYRGKTIGIATRREKQCTAQLRRYNFGDLQQPMKGDKYRIIRVSSS